MSIVVRPYRELKPEELEEWKRLVKKAQPPGEVRLGSDLHWADLAPETDYLIQLWDEDELRACVWVTQRAISISGRETLVAGIRGVVTDPEQRRRGYGRAVMERAHELMRSFADCEFAVLFSSVMAVPFYEDLGWRAIRGPVDVRPAKWAHRLHRDAFDRSRNGAQASAVGGLAGWPGRCEGSPMVRTERAIHRRRLGQSAVARLPLSSSQIRRRARTRARSGKNWAKVFCG